MSDVTTADLRELLRAKYSGGGAWVIFEEVHDMTGYGRSRACDAIAMSIWPSKGLELHGFEIKTSRADWLNELRDPDKSAVFRQFCDRWWLIGSGKAIVKGDLPPDWGFQWARSGKLVTSRGAPKLEPKPIDREFLASLLRRAYEHSTDKDERDAAYQRGIAEGKERVKDSVDWANGEIKDLKGQVDEFQARSGLRITTYNGARLGSAVEALRELQGRRGALQRLVRLQGDLQERAAELGVALGKLKATAAEAGLVAGD